MTLFKPKLDVDTSGENVDKVLDEHSSYQINLQNTMLINLWISNVGFCGKQVNN